MKVSVHKKHHRRAGTRKAVTSKKYGTFIIVPKRGKVKLTWFDLIKSFDINQMACLLANFQLIGEAHGDATLAKRILESEAVI